MRQTTQIIKLDSIPTGTAQQRKMAYRNGKVMSYPSKSLEKARRVYNVALRGCEKPSEPFAGAVKLTLGFHYGTKDKRKIQGIWKTTRPDCDNVAKVFVDSLVHHGWMVDDANIVQLSITKTWDTRSYVFMILEEV